MGTFVVGGTMDELLESIVDDFAAQLKEAEARLHPWTRRKTRLDRIRRNKIKRAWKRFLR